MTQFGHPFQRLLQAYVFSPLKIPRHCLIIAAMNTLQLPIRVDESRIRTFCRDRRIRKLSFFGSVLRPDFDPNRSDVDVLVEFEKDAHPGIRFFGYGDELSEILGHRVDFNTAACLSQYFRNDVINEVIPIYEQT